MTKVKVEKTHKEKVREQERMEPLAEEAAAESVVEAKAAEPEAESGRESAELEELKSKLEQVEKQHLYLRSDFANYKRNAEQERGTLAEVGREAVLKEGFGVFELLEKAIASGREHKIDAAAQAGLELVNKEFLKVFEKFKVERIKTVGEKFDPAVHEATGLVEDSEHEPDTVVFEQQPGFLREGKVLRPARVLVAKPKA